MEWRSILVIVVTLSLSGCADIGIGVAAQRGDIAGANELLAHGANVNSRTGFPNRTPLTQAAENGHVEMVRFLLAHGANVNLGTFQTPPPLWAAAKHGYVDIVEILLDHGAEINDLRKISEVWGVPERFLIPTPLMLAAKGGYADVVKILLVHGADINVKDQSGKTAYDYALADHHPEIAELIRSYPEVAAKRKLNAKLDGIAQALKWHFDNTPKPEQPQPLSEDFRKEMVAGLATVKNAKTQEDYLQALEHFAEASRVDPCAPAPYEALGHISESVGSYSAAIDFYNLYLLAAPNAPNARAIKDHTYGLEDKAKSQQGE
ncbi:MAG: ankyrin repeat domain-containing protein [Betaproteobacteria bacterium]|nr:ankyrin repeat domain-containing protein [Betaproteobacteria bacterium]